MRYYNGMIVSWYFLKKQLFSDDRLVGIAASFSFFSSLASHALGLVSFIRSNRSGRQLTMPVPLVTTALCTAACAAMQDCNDDDYNTEDEDDENNNSNSNIDSSQQQQQMNDGYGINPTTTTSVAAAAFANSVYSPSVRQAGRLWRKRKSSVSFQEGTLSSSSQHGTPAEESERKSGSVVVTSPQQQQQQQQGVPNDIESVVTTTTTALPQSRSIHSIFDRRKRKKGRKSILLTKSETFNIADQPSDIPRGFVDGNFASGKVLDVRGISNCFAVAFHPNKKVLAIGLLGGRGVALYETRTFTVIQTLERQDCVSALSWLPLHSSITTTTTTTSLGDNSPMNNKNNHGNNNSNSNDDSISLLAVGGLDGTVSLYSMSVDLLELRGADLLHQYQLSAEIRSICLSLHGGPIEPRILLAAGTKHGKLYFSTLHVQDNCRHIRTQEADTTGSAVLGIMASPTGSLLAYCTKAGDVLVHRVERGDCREETVFAVPDRDQDSVLRLGPLVWSTHRNGPVYAVEFSPDESRMVLGGYDKTVLLVETQLWAVVRELQLSGTVSSMKFDALNRYLAVGCRDRTFTLYDTSTYYPIKTLETSGWVSCVSWGDSDYLALRSDDDCVSVLDLSPIRRTSVHLPAFGTQVYGLSWSYDGRFLARIKGKCVHICDAHSGFEDVATVLLDDTLKAVAYCHAEGHRNLLATVGVDGEVTVIVCHVEGKRCLAEVVDSKSLDDESLMTVAWSSDGELLAAGGRGQKLHILKRKGLTNACTPISMGGRVWSVDFMPAAVVANLDGAAAQTFTLAVGCGDYMATVLDVTTFSPVLRVMRPRTVRCVAFHPTLPYLALGDGGNTVMVVDILEEDVVHEAVLTARVNTLAFSPLGDFLVVGTDDCSFTVHETTNYKVVQKVDTKGFAHAAAFSGSSGKYLALASAKDGYSIIQLGPFLATDLVPLDVNNDSALPSWAVGEVLYRSGHGPSLVQRYMLEGSQDSLRQAAHLLKEYPDTISTFDRSTGIGCFDTALQLQKPNLLKLVMTTVVDGTLEAETGATRTILTSKMPMNARETLQNMVSNHAAAFTVEVLSEMTYIKVPFTTPKEIYRSQIRECGSSNYMDPWDSKVGTSRRRTRGFLSRSQPTGKIETKQERGLLFLTPAVLPLPDLGTRGFLTSLINTSTPSVFDNEAMGLVVRVMWRDFIRPYFLVDLSIFSVYLLLWTALVDLTSSNTATSTWKNNTLAFQPANVSIIGVVVVILNTVFAVKEMIQSKYFTSKAYYKSLWNAVDVFSILSVYFYVLSTVARGGPGNGNVPLAVFTTLLLTMKLLSYLRGFDGTGWLISVLIQNFKDVSGFTCVLAVILFGFTVSFRLLLGSVDGECELELNDAGVIGEDCKVAPFHSMWRSFLSTFELTIVGSYNPGVFDDTDHTLLAVFTFVLAVTCVLVVALNALIAVLSDSYARVQENAVGNLRRERAELIVEYLSIIPPFRRHAIEQQTKYFHALLEADEDGDLLVHKDDWQGGLAALRRDMEEHTERETETLTRTLGEIRTDIDKELSDFRRDMATAMEDLAMDIKQMKHVQSQGGVTINGRHVARGVRAVKSIGKKVMIWRGNDP